MGEPGYGPDQDKTDLERRFPDWEIRFTRWPQGGVTWYARPILRLIADTPEELAEAIRDAGR